MFKLLPLVGLLLLTGCAHWENMTQQQKNITIGTTIAGLVVGAVVNKNNGNNNNNDSSCNHHRHHCDD